MSNTTSQARPIPRADLRVGMFVETVGYNEPVGAAIVRITEKRDRRRWENIPVLHFADQREPIVIDHFTSVRIRDAV
jgi:hypothetical protein